jgi:hypothetical protein
MAKSRHTSLRSLQKYARPGVDAVAKLTAEHDPARRRRYQEVADAIFALADQTPDPQLAALIAVAVLARCPHYLRRANLRGLASDGAVLAGPWGGALTIPPELRRFLTTWHHEREPLASAGAMPLFPGNSHGRAGQPAIRRRLAQLDAPASLWEGAGPGLALAYGWH